MAAVQASTPSFVIPTAPTHDKSREWGSLIVELFKKVMSDRFEEMADFQRDISEIYQAMSQVLLKTYEGKNPLEPSKEAIEKETSELYLSIVKGKTAGRSHEELCTQMVASRVFQAFSPSDPSQQVSENYQFVYKMLVPYTLKEVPHLLKVHDVRQWFTSAYVFAVKKEDLSKQRELLGGIPLSVMEKIIPLRGKIGADLLRTFNQADLKELIEILSLEKMPDHIARNSKVSAAAMRYFELFALAKDESGDYREALRQSLLVGFKTLMAKLSA
jgi:hypothetical protein